MIASHIHDAIAQVRRLRRAILEKRRFRGYSGTARLLSGTVALAGAAVMASGCVRPDPLAHLAGWSVVLVLGVLLNYAALFYWFLFDREVRRNPGMLSPALDAIPALAVGALLSVAAIRLGQYDMLFGIWLCLYGLAQVAYRTSLPTGIYAVGICYLVAGAACLLVPSVSFLSPWPMGVAFFAGETAGGIVLIRDHMINEKEEELPQ